MSRPVSTLVPLAALVLGACAGPAASSTASPVASPASDTPAAAAGPDRKWCQLRDGRGTFLLFVTSAAEHDFSICGGGSIVDTDLDKVLGQAGWDRRCLTS